MKRVVYQSNNSGGSWWLTDKNWQDLEDAGWRVDWVKDLGDSLSFFRPDEKGRWLGALATSATREGKDITDAVAEWRKVTGLDECEPGCPCCGQPHRFTEYDGDEYVASGPETTYAASWS